MSGGPLPEEAHDAVDDEELEDARLLVHLGAGHVQQLTLVLTSITIHTSFLRVYVFSFQLACVTIHTFSVYFLSDLLALQYFLTGLHVSFKLPSVTNYNTFFESSCVFFPTS